MCFQIRPVTHAAAQSHPTDTRNSTQPVSDDDDEERFSDWKTRPNGWKWQLVKTLKIRKHIPVLRSPRENQSASSTKTQSKAGALGIFVHPFHQALVINGGSATNRNSNNLRHSTSSLGEIPKGQEDPQSRVALLQSIAETQSVSEAWEAYSTLLSEYRPRVGFSHDADEFAMSDRHDELTIPFPHLHRLARLLSTTRPRTRQLFLRLLSVLTTLRRTGGPIFLWEWNALIDCAGKGWRKTNIDDYRTALSIFQDMVTSNRVASSSSKLRSESSEWRDLLPADMLLVEEPNIITFTTLLDIASRTLDDKAIRHALSLLTASELPWNNATHMARLPYFIHTNQLHAVRGILSISVTRGLDIITLNGCLWAYAHRGRLRVVMQVYDLLRRNIPKQDRIDFGESDYPPFPLNPGSHKGDNSQDENPILSIPGFVDQAKMAPDVVTYTLLIQSLCYHGDLIGALTVLRDMVSTVDPALQPPGSHGGNLRSSCFKPTYATYRAIFLGFARHADKLAPTLASSLMTKQRGFDTIPLKEFAARLTASSPEPTVHCPAPEELAMETPWTLGNLEKIFARFLEMDWEHDRTWTAAPAATKPSDRMIYWIIVAYAKTSKRDIRRIREVWKKLDIRFGFDKVRGNLESRLGRIAKELEEYEHQRNSDDGF
jgi:pentatricopeptide repeat protein